MIIQIIWALLQTLGLIALGFSAVVALVLPFWLFDRVWERLHQ